MPKRLSTMVVALAAIAGLVAPTNSSAGTSRFAYANADLLGAWDDKGIVSTVDTPVGRAALWCCIEVVPTGSRFTIAIDDFANQDGEQVWVNIHSDRRTLFNGCMPVRSTVPIAGNRGRAGVDLDRDLGSSCSRR